MVEHNKKSIIYPTLIKNNGAYIISLFIYTFETPITKANTTREIQFLGVGERLGHKYIQNFYVQAWNFFYFPLEREKSILGMYKRRKPRM